MYLGIAQQMTGGEGGVWAWMAGAEAKWCSCGGGYRKNVKMNTEAPWAGLPPPTGRTPTLGV